MQWSGSTWSKRAIATLAVAAAVILTPAGPGLAAQEALVLSGGSARGLAHVGVLVELEALGYAPGIVVGTSMGAVIGALYAAGYSPGEIQERVGGIEWDEMFDPTPTPVGPGRELRLPMATFSLDPARRRVSRGLFGDWRINRALVGLLFDASARAAGDFDRLARRYRAVATDLETGERVVLGTGDLARAVRASMAYPGFFPPVQWDGRLLVDGGIADNLPTVVARELGADHVVAVDVGRPSDDVSQDALAVAGRALRLMTRNIRNDSLPPDVLIQPALDQAGIGPAFPDDPDPLIELGREAARRDLPPPGARASAGEQPLPRPPARFGALRIEAADSALATLARQVFARVAPGPYDPAAVLAAVDRLYGTDLFVGVWPRVERDGAADDGPTLVVRVDAVARLSLTGAAGFENDRGGRAWAALDRTVSLLGRPAMWRAAVSTDGLERFASLSVRVQPGARPTRVWSVGAHARERSVRTFAEDTRSTLEVVRAGGWLALELPHLVRERGITLTGRAEWIEAEDGPTEFSAGPLLRVTSVPTDAQVVGIPLLLEAEARWGGVAYRRVGVAGSRIFGGPGLQAALLVDARAVSRDAPADVLPALGDQHAIPGLRWGEERGRARVVAGAEVAVPVALSGFARLRLRAGAVGDRPEDWDDARWLGGALLGGIWRTPLGVLEAGYGLATTGDGRFDVSIGRSF